MRLLGKSVRGDGMQWFYQHPILNYYIVLNQLPLPIMRLGFPTHKMGAQQVFPALFLIINYPQNMLNI